MSAMNETKHVVVTGASAGVGRATAQAFAKRGYKLTLLARGEKGLSGAKSEVEALGGEAIYFPVDVSIQEQVEAAAKKAEEHFGPIDIWVNNAMVSVFSPVKKMLPEEYRRVTEVTYLGAVYGTLTALKTMLPRDRGVIVQVGSALCYRSIPLQSAYCGAKHALMGFTESLRCELLHDKSNIHLTIVHLPAVNTPQFDWVKSRLPNRAQPVPPIFQPEVPAEAIVNATRQRRREWFVGFPTLKAIWADKLVPNIADYYLAANGYESQQTEEKAAPDRADNLWRPVDKDFGAHGRFDSRSKGFSLQHWVSKNRMALSAMALFFLTSRLLSGRR